MATVSALPFETVTSHGNAGAAMPNQIDIDGAFIRAIVREIGERLRTSLIEHELPASLRSQLDRLVQMEHPAPPSVTELQAKSAADQDTSADPSQAEPEDRPSRWYGRWTRWHRDRSSRE